MYPLFERFLGNLISIGNIKTHFIHSSHLFKVQQDAVQAITYNQDENHSPWPSGTGKTTTLIEGILQLIKQGKNSS